MNHDPLLIFDWGGTLMIDYALPGPMYLWEKIGIVPGVQKALEALSGQYPMVVATNAPHSGSREMVKALEIGHLKHYFRSFYSSKELKFGKPDPRFFRAIAEKEQVDPEDCIMIGNHYRNDIEGAKQAGMKTILYNEKQLNAPLELADKVIDHMSELAEAVAALAISTVNHEMPGV